jgi:hypothetical protein
MDILHEEIKHLVGNDVDTLYGEKNHLIKFSFIKVYDNHSPHKAQSKVRSLGQYYLTLLAMSNRMPCKCATQITWALMQKKGNCTNSQAR